MERAKELFYQYCGNRFYMDHDGAGWEYDSYHITKETETMWAEEFVSGFLQSKLQGKEARRGYSTAAELIKYDRSAQDWERCLYYPLRAEQLDDVTILYMLFESFRMAEKAAKAGRFSKEKAEAYLPALERYSRSVRLRAEQGTLSRAAEYVLREFSDPIYVAEYLSGLQKKWEGLFRRQSV